MNLDLTLLAKKNQTIEQHTREAMDCATIILNRLGSVVQRMAEALPLDCFNKHTSSVEQVKTFITENVQFHDYGKVNPYLQEQIKSTNHHSKEKRQHAIYSYLLWLCKKEGEQGLQPTHELWYLIAYGTIKGHHNRLRLPDMTKASVKDLNDLIGDLFAWGVIDEQDKKSIRKGIARLNKTKSSEYADIALTIAKLSYSVLTLSDSIASSEIPPSDYELAVNRLIGKTISQTDLLTRINDSQTAKAVQSSSISVDETFEDQIELNDIRTLLNKKSSHAYNSSADIYVLEAPVGAGKTHSSLSLAKEIIKEKNKRKIVSVFPLNSVQAQYQETVLNEMKADEQWINVINSESLFRAPDLQYDLEELENVNKSNMWLFERSCFSSEWVITSHVRFFDTLACITRQSSLGFLSLIDSVVIIDEFQTYPPHYWEGIWNELLRLSDFLGITWIFTTGTFPVSKKQLLNAYGNRISYVLTDEENNQLFSHAKIKGRCDIITLSDEPYHTMKELSLDIMERIKEKKEFNQFLICLSFVKHAKEVFEHLSHYLPEYHVYFLCGRHSSAYKKELIRKIHEHNQPKHRQERMILVTTKTVECGMDFDFDYGFKEHDMFPSVEQLSGRINRHSLRKNGGLELFSIKRREMDIEKYFSSFRNSQAIDLMNNKAFLTLFHHLYAYNKMNVKTKQKIVDRFHHQLDYDEHEKFLRIIQSNHYTMDIYLVKSDEEAETFRSIVNSFSFGNSYAEQIIQSMKLRKELECFQMTVSLKWLMHHLRYRLVANELDGIPFYLIGDQSDPLSILDRFKVGDVSSYLEKEIEDEESYEFY
ncbi:CRISPR-associated helicase Cas3' [Metabacillus hrfriensis]|uniref:CRISPR-associated helicase Cas3 n=1 Tax=Metabacillus hrfriensis TaxID=3048891 RepID=A0ACD4RHW0_9BACI|nr:CRISPR-associated helicase Cas3' [Metabacillus sp. CT-WN-B3]WHZ60079.1 CRISPR-associated helicase Cas3' [Metabacillus sp. CT-WN-B3]